MKTDWTLRVVARLRIAGVASVMPRPVHAGGDQRNGGRVHQVNGPFELPGKALACASADKVRREAPPKCSNTAQKSFSTILADRTLLLCDKLLRVGAVAPRILDSGPESRPNASHTWFNPMLWLSCAVNVPVGTPLFAGDHVSWRARKAAPRDSFLHPDTLRTPLQS